ncbi:hypothetical protein [Actinoplanes derwentensis]|uniref:Glycosyl transferase family 2 n=1 Tax=Actinoplanes derwentensis TaxID=113562 RepID=A0A1H1WX01_9ACTN|nr:hypothetical protein [Actinoplanes derwentensis]GID86954.1 hypothetical protein Ade03nite_58780 [Actinoplanes derwentensis]SDT01270.1 hypothetical protein SAMN04489716_2253 [Actinoplanes derwentensis]
MLSYQTAELHHGSHTDLLQELPIPAEAPAGRGLDAIIVPTAWSADALRHAMQVAKTIDCPVVALCSRAASAAQTIRIADQEAAAVLAVDVDPSLAEHLPRSDTDLFLQQNGFGSTSDLSLKRNLGTVFARGSGWQRVLFLDDDIHIDDPAHLHRVAPLVDDYRAVGLANHGFADNSVVCHANRAVDGPQSTFIGGGAMIVDTFRTRSFFPNIYNEDWFFLLGDGVPFRAARSGTMHQRPYDPFANPARAVAEELGDTLAEGLFWLLDGGQQPANPGSTYWGDALYRRRHFIDLLLAASGDGPDHHRMRRSLEAARGRSADITYRLCHRFVELWQSDLDRWRLHLDRAQIGDSPEKFLHKVRMSHHVQFSKAYLNSRR